MFWLHHLWADPLGFAQSLLYGSLLGKNSRVFMCFNLAFSIFPTTAIDKNLKQMDKKNCVSCFQGKRYSVLKQTLLYHSLPGQLEAYGGQLTPFNRPLTSRMVVEACHVPVRMVLSKRISDHRRVRFGHQNSAIRKALLSVGYPGSACLVIF